MFTAAELADMRTNNAKLISARNIRQSLGMDDGFMQQLNQQATWAELTNCLADELELCRVLNAGYRKVNAPRDALETLVKCAYEMEELTTMRCCEILGEDVVTFRERGWIQSRVLEEKAELQAENAALIEGIRYWSYCTSEGMRATAPEKCDELVGFLMGCKIAPYYMPTKEAKP